MDLVKKNVVRTPPARLTAVTLVAPPTLLVSLQWALKTRRGRPAGTNWEQIDVIVTYGCGSGRTALPNVIAEFGINSTDVSDLVGYDMPRLVGAFLACLNDTLTLDYGLGLTAPSYSFVGEALEALIQQRAVAAIKTANATLHFHNAQAAGEWFGLENGLTEDPPSWVFTAAQAALK